MRMTNINTDRIHTNKVTGKTPDPAGPLRIAPSSLCRRSLLYPYLIPPIATP